MRAITPRTALALLATAVAFLALGLYLGGHPNSLPSPLRDAFVSNDNAVRDELINDVRASFYKPTSAADLNQASLAGIVSSLHDPFSQYFSPAETKLFNQDVNSQFEGVGLTIAGTPRGLRVMNVIPGSPAIASGIRSGDQIVSVDGRSLAGKAPDVASTLIKGPAGTSVTLGILSPGAAAPRSLTVRRARIQVPVAAGRIVTVAGKKIGVVRLTTFAPGAHGELRLQIDRLLKAGARGLVLDLRDNGGGLLQEGIAVASIFVPNGLIVSTRGRTQPEQRYPALGGAIDPAIPVLVLVNGGTASAAEIVTGALRDHGRATIAGTKTYGKGVFQDVEPLSNDGTLKITVGSYYLPNGENLAGNGIVPAVAAADDPKQPQRDLALPIALRTLAKSLK